MAASFPGAIKAFVRLVNGLDKYKAEHLNDAYAELEAIEAELGTNPKGSAESVGARIGELENAAKREVLTADRTYYVRTDGNDNNSGLSNDAAGALATIQKAVDLVSGSLDLGGHTVTIQVGAGTYAAGVQLKNCIGVGGSESVIILGNETNPETVIINPTGASCFLDPTDTFWNIRGLKLQATGAGTYGFKCSYRGLAFQNIEFGAVGMHQIGVIAKTALVRATGNMKVSGGGICFAYCEGGHIELGGKTIVFSGSPAYTGSFITCNYIGLVRIHSCTFTNKALVSGKRFDSNNNSQIFTMTDPNAYLPGTVAGSTANGGLAA
jgi:hypothetical protein